MRTKVLQVQETRIKDSLLESISPTTAHSDFMRALTTLKGPNHIGLREDSSIRGTKIRYEEREFTKKQLELLGQLVHKLIGSLNISYMTGYVTGNKRTDEDYNSRTVKANGEEASAELSRLLSLKENGIADYVLNALRQSSRTMGDPAVKLALMALAWSDHPDKYETIQEILLNIRWTLLHDTYSPLRYDSMDKGQARKIAKNVLAAKPSEAGIKIFEEIGNADSISFLLSLLKDQRFSALHPKISETVRYLINTLKLSKQELENLKDNIATTTQSDSIKLAIDEAIKKLN